MFKSAPSIAVVKKAGLIPAISLVNNRQRHHAYRILFLPQSNKILEILSITFRDSDAYAQPGEIKSCDWDWVHDQKVKEFGQRLANRLTNLTRIDTSYRLKHTERLQRTTFPGKVEDLGSRESAIKKAVTQKGEGNEISFYTDGSNPESGRAGRVLHGKIVLMNGSLEKLNWGRTKKSSMRNSSRWTRPWM